MDKLTKKSYVAGYCFALKDILESYFEVTDDELNKHEMMFLKSLLLERIDISDGIKFLNSTEEMQ